MQQRYFTAVAKVNNIRSEGNSRQYWSSFGLPRLLCGGVCGVCVCGAFCVIVHVTMVVVDQVCWCGDVVVVEYQ